VNDIPRTISLEPFVALISAGHFLMLAAFLAVMLTLLDSEKRLRSVLIFLSVFGFGYAFFAVLQSVLSPDKIYGIYGRPGVNIFGSFVNRNHFAAWMEMAIALPLAMLFSGVVSKDKRLLFVTAVTLMGIAILLSGSRGGLIAFFVEVIFLALVTYGSGKRRLGLRIALAAALVLAAVGGTFFVGGESSLSRIADPGVVTVDQSRSHIWSVSLKMIENGMPWGVGLGAFGTAYAMFDASSGLQRVEQAHNDYLQVLTDAGLPGLVIGAAFLFLLFQTGRAALSVENPVKRAIAAGALTGIIAVLIHSAFDFVLHTTAVAILFIVLLSTLIASTQQFPDEQRETHSRRKRSRHQHESEGMV
jgi:O-antigen ligase